MHVPTCTDAPQRHEDVCSCADAHACACPCAAELTTGARLCLHTQERPATHLDHSANPQRCLLARWVPGGPAGADARGPTRPAPPARCRSRSQRGRGRGEGEGCGGTDDRALHVRRRSRTISDDRALRVRRRLERWDVGAVACALGAIPPRVRLGSDGGARGIASRRVRPREEPRGVAVEWRVALLPGRRRPQPAVEARDPTRGGSRPTKRAGRRARAT